MPKKPVLHPTAAERSASLALAELAARWCADGGYLVPPICAALDAARGYVASEVTRKMLDALYGPLGTYGAPVPDGTPAPIAHARDAAIVARNIVVLDPRDGTEFDDGRRTLFASVESVGLLFGFDRPADAVRLTWADALAGENPRAVVPNSPEHALLILRGLVVKKMRTRLLLTPEKFCVLVGELGGNMRTTQLSRVENGTAALTVARDTYLARALKVDVSWIDDKVTIANAFAEKLAEQAAGVTGERWYADVAAQDGDESARNISGVAVLTTLRKSA